MTVCCFGRCRRGRSLKRPGENFSNLVFIRVDARFLPEIFEKDEVDGIYLNFSDPWPKARHAKRRLTSREFLKRYEQVLKKDGAVEFKTDNRELFEFSLEEVKRKRLGASGVYFRPASSGGYDGR